MSQLNSPAFKWEWESGDSAFTNATGSLRSMRILLKYAVIFLMLYPSHPSIAVTAARSSAFCAAVGYLLTFLKKSVGDHSRSGRLLRSCFGED